MTNRQIKDIVLGTWQAVGRGYEKAHPAVKIQFECLENEDFKAKLPTLLQSEDPPIIPLS